MKLTQLALDKIDLCDDRFRISYFLSFSDIVPSISKSGLLNPPVLVCRDERNIVVSGWRRVLACRELARDSIPVFISTEKEDLELFKIPVYENLSFRKYNVIEKAEILKKLRQFGEDGEGIRKQYLPLLEIPPTKEYLGVYLKLAEFNVRQKKALLQRKISQEALKDIVLLSSHERSLILPWLLCLSLNKQKQFLIDLLEISKRDNLSLKDVFGSDRFIAVQENKNLSPVQRANRICALLHEKRYPMLSQWNRVFNSILKKMELPPGIVISPSLFFEGEEMTIKFSFKTRDEFLKTLEQLFEMSSHKDFSSLFEPFSDD